MKRTLVVAEKSGQLGNHLILFAHLIALAQEYDLRILNPSFHQYRKHFTGSRGGLVASYPALQKGAPSPTVEERLYATTNLGARLIRRALPPSNRVASHTTCKGYTPEFDIDFSSQTNQALLHRAPVHLLFGWRYRNYALFQKHEQAIRNYFEFYDTMEARNSMDSIKKKSDIVIGIHVRHGDYKDYLGGKYYLSISQYASAAHHLIRQIGRNNISVMVFSNEEQDLSVFEGLDVYAGPGGMMSDFQALSFCDYLVAVPSTFSRWASFLGNTPIYNISRDDMLPTLSEMEPAKW